MKKRIISLRISKIIIVILIIVMILSSLVYGTVLMKQKSFDNLDSEQLKATYYCNSDTFLKYTIGNWETPYKEYLKEMTEDSSFAVGFETWKGTNFVTNLEGGVTEDDVLSEKGYYEAILFEMFYEPQRKNSFIDDLNSEVSKSNVAVYKSIRDAYESVAEFGAYPSKTEILSDDELYRLRNAVYEQGGKEYIDVFGSIETFNKAVGSAKTINDLSNRIGTLLTFDQVGESRVNVLEKMYEICDNEYLREAIEEMIQYYEHDFSVTYIVGKEAQNLAIDALISKASSYVWSETVQGLGGGWIKLAYTVGMAVSNAWLSTDQHYESFYQMKSLSDIEDLLKQVTKHTRDDFKKNPSDTNAVLLNSCVDVCMSACELGYEYSEKYLTMLDDMGINHVAQALGYPGIDHSEMITKFQKSRKMIEFQFNTAEVLLDELGQQGKSGYEDAYESPYDIKEQEEFNVYLELCADMQKIMPGKITRLKTDCEGSVEAEISCTIGPMRFDSLKVSDCRIVVNGNSSGGNISLNAGEINIDGDLTLGSITNMTSEDDLLRVEGDFKVGTSSYTLKSNMTAGRVELCGDLTLAEGSNDKYGYRARSSCRTIFCGEELQTVKGYYWDTDINNDIDLGPIEIQNSKFTMDLDCGVYESKPTIKLMADAEITEGGNFECHTIDLNGHKLKTVGKVGIYNSIVSDKDEATLDAKQGVYRIGGYYVNLKVENGTMHLGDNVDITSLDLLNGKLYVDGDLTLGSITNMTSEDDLLRVEGNIEVGTNSSSLKSNMTAGRVELCGDCTFRSSGEGYRSSGTCITVFCGDRIQKILGNSTKIKSLKNVINAHDDEKNLTCRYSYSDPYIWDPSYKTGDRYMELATVTDNRPDGYEYTGNVVPIDLNVNYGSINLKEGEDYTVEYSNNKKAGTAEAKISGIGKYKHSQSVPYKIVPADIKNVTIGEIPAQIYTGTSITPDIELAYDGISLKKGQDYETSYENNVHVGKAKITVKGIGNFTGNITMEFEIVPDDSIPEENLEIAMIDNIREIPDVLSDYYVDPKEIIQLLPDKVKGILTSGRETELKISWSCNGYNKNPSAVNKFKWKLSSDKYAIKDNLTTSGEVIIVNKAISSVTIGAADKTIGYCKNATVKDLFDIDAKAGKASYQILSGGTGKGTLDGDVLNVDVPGSFIIKITTARNGNYDAGEAVATLTVGLPKINAVHAPEIKTNTLKEFYDDASSVAKTLPDTVIVETEKGTVAMRISWFCEKYNAEANAENTFVWVVEPEEYVDFDVNGAVLEGEVKLYNKDSDSVFDGQKSVRVYGTSRYETALNSADVLKKSLGVDKFENIIVADGSNYPDALTGSYLAKVKEAPILLVNDSSAAAVRDYIRKNLKSGGTIYILGGSGAVSGTFENNLKNADLSVKRLAGQTRYDTNISILKEAGVKKSDLLICSGNGFADSLSASAAGLPILLVDKTVSTTQKIYLDGLSIDKLYLIGGSGAVNASVEKTMKQYGAVERLAGKTRYDTSKAVVWCSRTSGGQDKI